jgi:regulatory protein
MAFKKPTPLDENALFDYALRALGSRGHSISELKLKLKRRAEEPASIDAVLSKLKQYGYLNDRKYADSFTASRKVGKGFGRERVLRELGSKQVPRIVAEEAVKEAYDPEDEFAMADLLLQKKFRGKDLHEFLADPKNVQAAFRRLRYAGYSSAITMKVLKRYTSRADEIDESEAEGEPVEGAD